MILSAASIRNLLSSGELKIKPLEEESFGTVSLDLHLDKTILNPESGEEIYLKNFHLSPTEFYLANTQEFIALPNNLVARIVPKSSLARLGVLATFDADILPPNFVGKPLLTFKNLSNKPVFLQPGLPVAQIMFEEVDQEVVGYSSRYDHNKIEESKLCEDIK